jgi:hypothetical protein
MFKINGYNIDYNEEWNKYCIHIPFPLFNNPLDANQLYYNTYAIYATVNVARYLYNEGWISSYDFCVDYTDLFCPRSPINIKSFPEIK